MTLDEMLGRVIDMLAQIFKEFAEQVKQITERFDVLFDAQPEIWRPYRCRTCGRNYVTPEEVRNCMSKHCGKNPRTYASCMGLRKSTVRPMARVVPRNREASMRCTEMRRYREETQKQTTRKRR